MRSYTEGGLIVLLLQGKTLPSIPVAAEYALAAPVPNSCRRAVLPRPGEKVRVPGGIARVKRCDRDARQQMVVFTDAGNFLEHEVRRLQDAE